MTCLTCHDPHRWQPDSTKGEIKSDVKKILENNGGKVWVESDIGKGAKFSFTWPKESHVMLQSFLTRNKPK